VSSENAISLREYSRSRSCTLRAVQKAAADGRMAEAVVRDEAGRLVGILPTLADVLWAQNTDPVQALKVGKVYHQVVDCLSPLGAAIDGPEVRPMGAGGVLVDAPASGAAGVLVDAPASGAAGVLVDAPASGAAGGSAQDLEVGADLGGEDEPDPPEDIEREPSYQEQRAKRESYQAALTRLDLLERMGRLTSTEGVEKAAGAAARMVKEALLVIPDRVAALVAAETDPARVHAILTNEIRQALSGLADRSSANAADRAG